MIARKEFNVYVIQKIDQRKSTSYIQREEREWASTVHQKAQSDNQLVKYLDFKDFRELEETYPALAGFSGQRPQADPIADAEVLYPTQAYKEAVQARTGMSYDDLQTAEIRPEGVEFEWQRQIWRPTRVSGAVAGAAGGSGDPAVDLVDLDFELLRNVQLKRPWFNWEKRRFANAVRSVENVGPDIPEFYSLPNNLPLDVDNADFRKLWTEKVRMAIIQDETYYPLANNLIEYESLSAKDAVVMQLIRDVKLAMTGALEESAKMVALMEAAERSPEVKAPILGILARALNTKDMTIVLEAYKRIKLLVKRNYDLLDFHVNKKKYQHIVPVGFREGQVSTEVAYIHPFDPAGRFMIVVPNFRRLDPVETILHEASHHSVGTEDFRYFHDNRILDDDAIPGVSGMERAHKQWGRVKFGEDSLYFGVGRLLHVDNYGALDKLLPLTERDEALAYARMMLLPMLGANAKMNNADTSVILQIAFGANFDFRRTVVDGVSGWSITMKEHIRVPRDLQNSFSASFWQERNAMMRPLVEAITAAAFEQSLLLSADQILSDEQIERYGFGLNVGNRTLADELARTTDDPK